MLSNAREMGEGEVVTKSGLMVGLGESFDEMIDALGQLRDAGVSVITVGQYLRPTVNHLPIVRYWHPEEFKQLEERGYAMGFSHMACGPLVRFELPRRSARAAAAGRRHRPAPARCTRARGSARRSARRDVGGRVMVPLVVAQTAVEDTSSGAAIVFGMLVFIAALSILALTARGRRTLMPVIAILLGLVISYTSIADAVTAVFSVITVLGLLIGLTLVLGGFGALREGLVLPAVEGRDPEIEPRAPRITPDGDGSDQVGADSPEVR